MSVLQLVYISAATVPFSDDDLSELLDVARSNNEQCGVSGMLIYHDGAFIQVLEGDETTVDALFHKIECDERHDKTSILLRNFVTEHLFEAWSMGYVPVKSTSDIPDGFHSFLKTGFKESYDAEDSVRKALLAFKAGRWRVQ